MRDRQRVFFLCYNKFMLRILLLGPPAVLIDETPLDIKRRTLRGVLFYLACHRDSVGRDELMERFWPERNENEARINLRDTLAKLRAQLPDPELIGGGRDRVWLDFRSVYSDVLAFDELGEKVRSILLQTPDNVPLPTGVYQQVSEALRLWRSPVFMAGATLPHASSYDQWVTDTATRLELNRLRLLTRLADHCAATGDFEMAVDWTRSILDVDPLNEDANFRVIHWLSEIGHRSEAINQYNLFVKQLQRENMGSEYMSSEYVSSIPPAIEQLHSKILQQTGERTREARVLWPAALNLQVPFVGHSQPLQELRMAYRRGRAVLVMGEAGYGKTRLAYELYRSLDPSPRLLFCTARAMETALPYQPLVDMLRHSVHSDEWRALEPAWIATLSELMPELPFMASTARSSPSGSLLASSPLASSIADLGNQHTLLLEAFHRILLVMARKQRVLFVLDDAHWCDQDTLAALAYLVQRNFFVTHGLLLLTARPEEKSTHLQQLLDNIQQPFALTRITLAPLDAEEVAQLSQYVLGQAMPENVIHQLIADASGNPFFLLENLRSLMEFYPDLSQLDDQTRLPVSGNIYALLHQRILQLSPNANQVLTAAAIINGPFTPALVQEVAGLDAERVTLALEELEQARMIRPVTDPGLGAGYSIVQKTIRDAYLLSLSKTRQQLYHLRVARALQKRAGNGPQRAPVVAGHLEAGGDLRRAFDAWLETAIEASRLSLHDEAFSAFRKAELLLDRLGDSLPEEQVYRLYNTWVQYAFLWNDLEMTRSAILTLLQTGQRRRSALLMGAANRMMAAVSVMNGHPEMALEQIEQAIAYFDQAHAVQELISSHTVQAEALTRLGRVNQAQVTLLAAQDAIPDSGDTTHLQMHSTLEYHLARLQIISGNAVQAQALAASALAKAEQSFFSSGALEARLALARAYYSHGCYEEALEEYWKVSRLLLPGVHSNITCYLELTAARSYLAQGDLDKCWTALQKATDADLHSEAAAYKADILATYGALFQVLGDYPRAIGAHQLGVACGVSVYDRLVNLYSLGMALLSSGETDTGLDLVIESIQSGRASNMGSVYQPAEIALASYDAMHGAIDEAEQIVRRIEPEVRQYQFLSMPARLESVHALIALARGNFDAAQAGAQALIRKGQETLVVWNEMNGYFLSDYIRRQQGLPALHGDAVRRLLTRLSIKSQNEQVRPLFEAFRSRMLEQISTDADSSF
jgi:DNA-binding SARP family transcriptional activator